MPNVTVNAPSRLHFGMFAFEHPRCAYGGVGAMLEQPGLELRVEPADRFETAGPLAGRVAEFVDRVLSHCGLDRRPAARFEVVSAPPEHVGLGVGTQLGMAVAAAMLERKEKTNATTDEIAAWTARGRRSGVGSHGFHLGGLLVDGGHQAGSAVGRLEHRVALPEDWRWLLITPTRGPGLSGDSETTAFDRLPSIPAGTTDRLLGLAMDSIAPAAKHGDFDRFAQSLGEYGRAAGECFAPIQGGPFADAHIEGLVDRLAAMGAIGAGQSSWGPTVFAPAPSVEQAEQWRNQLADEPDYRDAAMTIAAPNNTGARVTVVP